MNLQIQKSSSFLRCLGLLALSDALKYFLILSPDLLFLKVN